MLHIYIYILDKENLYIPPKAQLDVFYIYVGFGRQVAWMFGNCVVRFGVGWLVLESLLYAYIYTHIYCGAVHGLASCAQT